MEKRRIRLTEQELYDIIEESFNEAVNEGLLGRITSYIKGGNDNNSTNTNQQNTQNQGGTDKKYAYTYTKNPKQVACDNQPDIDRFRKDADDEANRLKQERKYINTLNKSKRKNNNTSGTTTTSTATT